MNAGTGKGVENHNDYKNVKLWCLNESLFSHHFPTGFGINGSPGGLGLWVPWDSGRWDEGGQGGMG